MFSQDTPPSGYEWDPPKAEQNRRKHGVSFHEAATAFHDLGAIVDDDEEHSWGEGRLRLIGRSDQGRLLTVFYTMRSNETRIISARPAAPKHARLYWENNGT
jgi:uncharacterized protein